MTPRARGGKNSSTKRGVPMRVVGIGASAGGLEAIRSILQALPASTGMAYIVVQHLDPEHKSMLVELLERTTQMPTIAIEDGVSMEPDHVYVIPENADVTVEDGVLRLQPRPRASGAHEPFNLLLTSMASALGERAVGVVLSGSDRDGLVGMAAIREGGGVVLAQDPSTAQYPSMPQHVIKAGLADAILSPEGIAERLASLTDAPNQPGARPKPALSPGRVAPEEPSSPRLLALAEGILPIADERAAVIVDKALGVRGFHGDVARFVTIPVGPATLDLARMAPPEVVLELRRMVDDAGKSGLRSASTVVATLGEVPTKVSVEVVPMTGEADCFYLVVFGEAESHEAAAVGDADVEPAQLGAARELAAVRLQLRDLLEEKGAITEELQSSVEESQSVNEELQTAKEELQSTNEELITVNDELQDRNTELIALNSDLTSLLMSVDIPIVVLGKDLEIRRFTPAAQKVLSVIPGDVGRPITDLRLKIDASDLPLTLRRVFESGEPHEQEVRDEDGHWYVLKVRVFRTDDGEAGGAVISLLGIDETKRASQEVDAALAFADAIFDTVREPLVVLDSGMRVSQANSAFYKAFRVSKRDTEGKQLAELGAGQWDLQALDDLLRMVSTEDTVFQDFRVTYRFPKIGSRTMLLNARRVVRPELGVHFVLLAMEDVTGREGADAPPSSPGSR